jgi:hypothetical protein
MQYQILKEPMAILDVQMSSGEKITAESGAMVYMKGDIEIKTRTREGGFFKKIKVTALGGESFFVNDYVAHGDCSIGLTGPPLGDVVRLEVKPGTGYIVQSGSYVASTHGVLLDTQWQGFTKGLFRSEFFMLKATAQEYRTNPFNIAFIFGDFGRAVTEFMKVVTSGYVFDMMGLFGFPQSFITGVQVVFSLGVIMTLIYLISGRG